MNKYFSRSVYTVFAALLVANIYVFLSGVTLSDRINHYELDIAKFHQENLDLEKKSYDAESLTNAAAAAQAMNFTNKETPIYLDNLKYALNR